MALPRSHRLSLRLHRERLQKTGKTAYGRYFTVISTSSDLGNSRFAVLISKKTSPLSVDRHYIHRVVDSLLSSFVSTNSRDFLIIPKKIVLLTPLPELREDLFRLLSSF